MGIGIGLIAAGTGIHLTGEIEVLIATGQQAGDEERSMLPIGIEGDLAGIDIRLCRMMIDILIGVAVASGDTERDILVDFHVTANLGAADGVVEGLVAMACLFGAEMAEAIG